MKTGMRVVNSKGHYGTVVAVDFQFRPFTAKVQYDSTKRRVPGRPEWEFVGDLTVIEPFSPEQLPLDIPPAI